MVGAFVACIASALPAAAATIIVDSAADTVALDAAVTLREALQSMVAGADVDADVAVVRTGVYGTDDEIHFAIGAGVVTIDVLAPLPRVFRPLSIDGTTQPGFTGTPLVGLNGTAAGASATGLAVSDGSAVRGLVIGRFGGDGLALGVDLFRDGFESGAVLAWGGPTADGAAVTLDDVRVSQNSGRGALVAGGLTATHLEAGSNGGEGVLVETALPVEMIDCDVHDSGKRPGLPPNGSPGIRVLRAGSPAGYLGFGFATHGFAGKVHDNGGDGVVLGDLAAQSGVVVGLVSQAEIYGNAVGIRVQQQDDDARRTESAILSNNVHDNTGPGLYARRSFQKALATADRRTVSANDFHHNSVVGTNACTPAEADESASQVVFDGPVGGTDPTVSDVVDPIGPDPEFTEDYRCYWGADDTNGRTLTLTDCNNLGNPGPTFPESGGVANHCLWNGTQCRVAWDIGGVESQQACDSSQNRIFAYVNDPAAPGAPATQRGVFATNGAYVRARRNTWGVGGATNGVVGDVATGARVDSDNDCGSISTCP